MANWLKQAGQSVQVHSAHFDQQCPDHIWIPDCASRGWVIVSPDKRLEVEIANKAAVIKSQAKVFTVSSHGLCGEELASIIVVCRRRIASIATNKEGPFYVRISKHAEMSQPRFFSPNEKLQILRNAGLDE